MIFISMYYYIFMLLRSCIDELLRSYNIKYIYMLHIISYSYAFKGVFRFSKGRMQ